MKDDMKKEAKQGLIDMLMLNFGVILLPGVMFAVITIAGIINFHAGMEYGLIAVGFFAVVFIYLGVFLTVETIDEYKGDLAFNKRNFK